jgi:hypothetical protein
VQTLASAPTPPRGGGGADGAARAESAARA